MPPFCFPDEEVETLRRKLSDSQNMEWTPGVGMVGPRGSRQTVVPITTMW